MNKKWKLLVILIFVFCLTGCKTNYDIKIFLDNQVLESISLLEEKNKLLDDFSEEKFAKYVDECLKLNDLDKNLEKKKITYEGEDLARVDFSKKYKSLDAYSKRSKAVGYLFDKVNVEKNNSSIKITSVASNYEIDYDEYKDSTITINLPYKVIYSNADVVDKKYNAYTWNIDDDFDGIELEYSRGKLYTTNIFWLIPFATVTTYFDVFMLFIVLTLLIMIIVLAVMLLKRERKSF